MNKPIAIITGASTGIGRSLSIKLSKRYFIYLISRNKNKLQETNEIINNLNNECKIIVADISKKESIDIIYSQIENKENIELVINNAGIAIFNNITDLSIEDWDQQINTNLRGSFLITKMIINDLKSKKSGKIVFINSIAGLKPYKDSTAYIASKYGLRGFSAALRSELREYNIQVISIHPGAIDTPLWDNIVEDDIRKEMMSVENVSDIIINAINSPSNCTTEEIIIRTVKGDF